MTYTVLYCKLLLVTTVLLIVILDDAAINILTIRIVYIIIITFFTLPLILTDGPYPIILTGIIVTV